MKKMMKSVFNLKTLGLGSLLGFILMSTACNKDFDNVLPKSFKNDTLGLGNGTKKVLYIIMDGVKGSVIRGLAPTNLTQITSRSLYTYDGLTDYRTNVITNAAGWTNMLTGVDYTQHNVSSENFAGLNVQATPTIFARLKQNLNNPRMVSFASTGAFNDNLATDASVKQNLADDKAVKDATVNELTTNDASLIVAQFHSADVAGGNDYSANNAAYTSAISTLDGYLGEIMAALKARKTFAVENWMVIVASNKGGGPSGAGTSSSVFTDVSRNTFAVFYNPKFSPNQIVLDPNNLPYSGTAPNLTCTNTTRNDLITTNNTTIGSFGTSGDYTLFLKVRADHASVGGYPPFIGKTLNFAQNNPGWVLFTNGDNWNFKANGTRQFTSGSRPFRDGRWHTIAIRIYYDNVLAKRIAVGYQDGKVVSENLDVTNINMTSATPFTVGNIPTSESTVSGINVLMQDVMIYNVAIPEADLIAYMRKTSFLPTDPYYSNLIAYWPLNEGQGNAAIEKTGKAPKLDFVGTVSWKPFGDLAPNISPSVFTTDAYTAIPNGVDIPVLIYNWMNIAIQPQWNLMGKLYAPTINYSTK